MGWPKQELQCSLYNHGEEEAGQQEESATTIANWNGKHGRIDRSMLEKYLAEDEIANAIFYICGPPGMLRLCKICFKKKGSKLRRLLGTSNKRSSILLASILDWVEHKATN